MARDRDPSKNYNEGSGQRRSTGYGNGNGLAGSASMPLLPHQIQGAPNFWVIAAVLDGGLDDRYTYTPTSENLDYLSGDEGNFTFSFPHGLSFIPSVIGTFFYDVDEERRALPHTHFSDNQLYYDSDPPAYRTPDYVLQIDSVDKEEIVIRCTIMNDNGLTVFLGNFGEALRFKFYCFQDGTI